MTSSLSFSCVLITGGSGGLGKAMAAELKSRGKKVIIAGRTEQKLADTAKEIGAAGYYVLDTGDISSLSAFVTMITKDHPDLDCLINNAGIQRPLQIFGPDYDFDLDSADQEINVNIRGPLHLSILLIKQQFAELPSSVIMNVSSGLAFCPTAFTVPVYCATKAWVHSFTTNLRTQIEKSGKPIKLVEIVPPLVESDLHRDHTDPDNNKKSSTPSALSIEEFMQDVIQGWENDEDVVAAGMAKGQVAKWYDAYGEMYRGATSE